MLQASTEHPSPLRGLKPAKVLGESREHGDRLRYLGGCRCFACRRSNSAYEAARKVARAAGDWNGLVPANKAQAHLKMLSSQGIGRRSVAAASDVALTVLLDVSTGRKTQIRARTERAILAVDEKAAGDRALVPAKPTWKLLNRLVKDGYTKSELARRLGYKTRALQLDTDFVTVRNAHLVERLFDQLRSTCAKKTLALIEKLRDEGYGRHQVDQRLADLARTLGEETPDLAAPNGRITIKAAALVDRLYQQMTE